MPYNEPAPLPVTSGPPDPAPSAGLGYGANPDWSFLNQTPAEAGYGEMFSRLFPSGSNQSYPSPGSGPAGSNPVAPERQGMFGRAFNNTPAGFVYNLLSGHGDRIPAVRLARSIGNLFQPRQSWRDNATSNAPGRASARGGIEGADPASRDRLDRSAPPDPFAGGRVFFGFNPSSGGAGGTPHYDPGTGRTTITPSTNPLYASSATGGNYVPVSGAPADIRFGPNSGTGNFTADQTTKAYLLAGGQSGAPNNMRGVSDAGRTRFVPQSGFIGRVNPDTGMLERVPTRYDASRAFRQPTRQGAPNPADQAALNAWLMEQPEYAQWLATNPGAGTRGMTPAAAALPGIRISGPPQIGGGG